ncbi:reverse transcriptase family protein [Methylobacter luteus]|uniref:reverse transcriptase family protein n=1 Tax=Methylobacter luteus TaxID=415 RepID=UPI00041CE8CC|nr:reverse transcriptase family protein [Methylobacter luteus]
MADWKPQPYRAKAQSLEVDPTILDAAVAAGNEVVAIHPSLPPIFTLKHLAYLTDTKYSVLRMMVGRHIEEPYRVFKIRKRPGPDGAARFRVICAPSPTLLAVQSWLARKVLVHARTKVHSASTAYAPGCSILEAASPHCGCRWLIKVDIKNFFESVSEISAYHAFRSLGYQPLVSFELARLCTRVGSQTRHRAHRQWQRHLPSTKSKIHDYVYWRLGHLPQGAPTSPMLANIAMYKADGELTAWGLKHGLVYTRYADDMTFSISDEGFNRNKAAAVIRGIYRIIGKYGFAPNVTKTQVVPPRARKVVLGLLVDQNEPRLPREFKMGVRMHLHYLKSPKFGPAVHAANRGFTAVAGLRNHLFGLVAYAAQVEPAYGTRIKSELEAVKWPI